MNWEALFPGNYFKAADVESGTFVGKVSDVRRVALEDEKTGRAKEKGIVFFEGQERAWVLCKTNAMCLAAMFGPDTQQWIGHRVTLYSAMVSVGKEKKPGIRVKGSPDLRAPVPVEVKLPRRKAFRLNLVPTEAPEEEPITDPETGEVYP